MQMKENHIKTRERILGVAIGLAVMTSSAQAQGVGTVNSVDPLAPGYL